MINTNLQTPAFKSTYRIQQWTLNRPNSQAVGFAMDLGEIGNDYNGKRVDQGVKFSDIMDNTVDKLLSNRCKERKLPADYWKCYIEKLPNGSKPSQNRVPNHL